MPDYVPQETGTICLFRITPHEGVDPVEAAAAVASPAPPPGRWYRPTPSPPATAIAPRPSGSNPSPASPVSSSRGCLPTGLVVERKRLDKFGDDVILPVRGRYH